MASERDSHCSSDPAWERVETDRPQSLIEKQTALQRPLKLAKQTGAFDLQLMQSDLS